MQIYILNAWLDFLFFSFLFCFLFLHHCFLEMQICIFGGIFFLFFSVFFCFVFFSSTIVLEMRICILNAWLDFFLFCFLFFSSTIEENSWPFSFFLNLLHHQGKRPRTVRRDEGDDAAIFGTFLRGNLFI